MRLQTHDDNRHDNADPTDKSLQDNVITWYVVF